MRGAAPGARRGPSTRSGAARSGSGAERWRCGAGAARRRGAVRCGGAAVPDWALAARALASPLSLTQTSLLQLSPLAIGATSRAGTSRPRTPIGCGRRGAAASLSYFSVWRRGRPARVRAANFSSLLICISLYTFVLSLFSIAYLPSHLSFSFQAPLGLMYPFPCPGLLRHMRHFHMDIYIHTHIHIHAYIYIHICIYMCLCVCVCIYICLCVYIYTYIYLYVYICINNFFGVGVNPTLFFLSVYLSQEGATLWFAQVEIP